MCDVSSWFVHTFHFLNLRVRGISMLFVSAQCDPHFIALELVDVLENG